jgi:hypothetical protein
VTPLEATAVAVAAVGAGAVNAVVGSGTLITFPTLLAVGLPPVTANVSNTVGLVLGSFSAVAGYRQELAGQRRRLSVLAVASVAGAVIGGLLLLVLPQEAFRAIVPVLIGIGCVLVVVQPRLAARVATPHDAPAHGGPWLFAGVFATGIYGGYFGAAQGVLLIAVLGLALDEHLQRINAAKNLLAALVNLAAAVLFVLVADVAWDAAGLVAAGSVVGAFLGARFGRRLRPAVLRGLVVVVGVVAIVSVLSG